MGLCRGCSLSIPAIPPPLPLLSSSFVISTPKFRYHRSIPSLVLSLGRHRPTAVSAIQQVTEVAPAEEKDSVRPVQWKAAIDFKWIRENKDLVEENIKKRNSSADLEIVLELYEQLCGVQKVRNSDAVVPLLRNSIISTLYGLGSPLVDVFLCNSKTYKRQQPSTMKRLQEVERLRSERNAVATKMKGKLELSERQALVEKGKNLKEELAGLEENLVRLTDRLQVEGQCIPNLTHPDVPVGGEENSVVRRTVGSPREFSFPVKDHFQLGKELDLFDFDAASEVSGSKFYYLKNDAVLLEMGLINWALREVKSRGFTPLITPEIVRSAVVEKCGFQPRGQNTQVYSIDGSDQCLIGTAEIPVGGIHMDSILLDSVLPLKYVAYSHCFRTEAGAAGMATRGLYRVHQFSKVEMFIICQPEDSNHHLEELISIEEDLFKSLGLHYKTLDMATGDLGAPAYRKYDIEAWMPGLGRYGEISSASNCTDYQSRRLGIRFRPQSSEQSSSPKKGKGSNQATTRYVHTLNATACAVPRMIVCLLENFQQEDGSIVIPEPLRPYMGGLDIINPKLK